MLRSVCEAKKRKKSWTVHYSLLIAAISIRTEEAKMLMNHLNTERIQNQPEKIKSDLKKGIKRASRMAKAAEKRVVHYNAKIERLNGKSKP